MGDTYTFGIGHPSVTRGGNVNFHVDLRLVAQMSRPKTIDKRCDLFDHCIESPA